MTSQPTDTTENDANHTDRPSRSEHAGQPAWGSPDEGRLGRRRRFRDFTESGFGFPRFGGPRFGGPRFGGADFGADEEDGEPGFRPGGRFGPRGFGPGGFGPGGFGRGGFGSDESVGPVGPGGFGPGGRGGRGGRGGHGGRGWGGERGPGGGRGRRPRGNVRAAVLALLAEEPRHGYSIMTELAERSGGLWRPSPGSVYPVLQQLQDEGLVTAEESDGRKVFSLTPAGRDVLEQNPAEFAEPWSVAGPGPRQRVQTLFEGMTALGAAALQVARLGSAEQAEQARVVLDDARRALYRILAEETSEDSQRKSDDETPGQSGQAGEHASEQTGETSPSDG